MRLTDPSLIDSVGFYAGDVRMLEGVGFDVDRATRYRDVLHARPDVYYVWWWTWALPVVLLARLRRKPVYITGVFNYRPDDPAMPGYDDRHVVARFVIRWSARLATNNLFPSSVEFSNVPPALGVRNAAYLPLEVGTRPDGPPSVAVPAPGTYLFDVAWSGRSNLHRKCVYELIEAFESLATRFPDVRLVLAGHEGDAVAELQERIARSPRAALIDYLGRVDDATLGHLMRHAAVYVSPSRFEGFGLAIAEAVLVGTPVVTSAVGEVPHVVGVDGARYCDGQDPASIAEALAWCLEGGPAVGAMVARGRERVAGLDLASRVARASGLLRGGRRSRRP